MLINISPFLCSFKQQNLEQRQSDVEYELRCLLNKPGKAPVWCAYPFFHKIIEYTQLEGTHKDFFPWASSPLSLGGSQVKRGRSVGMPMKSAGSRGSVPCQCLSQPCAGTCSFCPQGMSHAGLCPHSTTSPTGPATLQGRRDCAGDLCPKGLNFSAPSAM